MPLIRNHYDSTSRLALWSLTEPMSFFEEKVVLSEFDKQHIRTIKSESRKKEWLAVRMLLHEVLGFWPQITYTENGRPLLQNHTRHLSISHTRSMVGILLSKNYNVGLDIEDSSRNVEKVATRFLSEKELNYVSHLNMVNGRILFWCAKESVFKAVNEPNVLFSKQIHIGEIEDQKRMSARYISGTKEEYTFVINFEKIDDHFVVWLV